MPLVGGVLRDHVTFYVLKMTRRLGDHTLFTTVTSIIGLLWKNFVHLLLPAVFDARSLRKIQNVFNTAVAGLDDLAVDVV